MGAEGATQQFERASIASSTGFTKTNKDYLDASTPDIEGGALRAGGAPDLYSRDSIGLLAQYAAVGIIYGAFPRTTYPFLNNYLRMDGYQTLAARTLVTMPWSFKIFIGMVSDSFPIMGFRRRPYMVIGWAMCAIMLIIMACLPVTDPYFLNPETRFNYTADELVNATRDHPELFNLEAPGTGSKYIVLMMFASIGYVVADVAADGMVVEYAHREPEATRGTTQTTIYMIRTIFQIFSTMLIAFGMNGKEYKGTFDFSLTFNQIMAILAVASVAVLPATVFLLKEEKYPRESFIFRLKEMWKILQQRVIWQIMAMKFFSGVFSNFSASPLDIVQREWAGVEPFNESVFTILAYGIMALTLYLTKNYGLHWDWRVTIAITTIVTVIIDAIMSFMTIFDVFRNQWFWLGVPVLEEFPYAIRFIVSTYVVVEIADEGYEGMTYGLITTVSNLSGPFSGTITNQVGAAFDAYQDDVKRDGNYERWQVAYTFIIMYVLKIASLGWLVLLPRQKKEAQELKRVGGSSAIAGVIAIVLTLFCMSWSVTISLLSIYESTSCLKVAGGDGC